jgi:hypothetical protein
MKDATRPKLQFALWAGAVIAGFAYLLGALGRSGVAFEDFAQWPKAGVIALKCTATGLLVAVAWLSAISRPRTLLALSLSIIWLADLILALGAIMLSGTIFVAAHLVALAAYHQLRSPDKNTANYHVMGLVIIISGMACTIIPALFFPMSTLMMLFPLFSLISAAAALRSRFPFWTLGAGTIIFPMSDVLGVVMLSAPHGVALSWLVWTTYFCGLALIAWALMRQRVA